MWRAVNPTLPGFTCCQNGDLANATSLLNDRIDLVFVRGGIAPLSAVLVGDQIADKTASGLWPSDHAGVVARVRP